MGPDISICIPAYNSSNLIERCLNSCLSLDHNDIEIVVSDDSSTDNTQQKLNQYTDPRLIKQVNDQNMGFDENVLELIDLANGSYLFFLSDEDIIMPTGFDQVSQIVNNSLDPAVIYGDVLDQQTGQDGYYYSHRSEYWWSSVDAIEAFAFDIPGGHRIGWWSHAAMSGTVVNKSDINRNLIQDYAGCGFMISCVAAAALINGGMYWVGEPIAMLAPDKLTDRDVKAKDGDGDSISAYSLEGKLISSSYRLQLLEKLNIPDELYSSLLDQEKKHILDRVIQEYKYSISEMYQKSTEVEERIDIMDMIYAYLRNSRIPRI